MSWKLTIRTGPRVEHQRFGALEDALDTIESRGHELEESVRRGAVDLKFRRFEPVQQVRARIELAGPERLRPSRRAGVDVRGDGSSEAYLGRVRRRAIEQRSGETSYKALRRAMRKTRS